MTAVSVVIPAYNRWDLTNECLASAGEGFELVFVDNGSTDETVDYLGADITIRNQENKGYAVACNQGAKLASGDVLVILTTDTVASPNWLEELVEPLGDNRIGMVGARLTYEDGRVNHTGIDLYRDNNHRLTACNRTDEHPSEPVLGVTGAAFAIRKELFDVLGGFDTGFYNGYEDVDLSLRVSQAGYLIWYAENARLVHYESQSGPSRWARVHENVARLQEKWPGVLA